MVVWFCRTISIFRCVWPIVGSVVRLRRWTMPATCCAMESSPAGKMIRAVSVFSWRHFSEGGLPPNTCAETPVDSSSDVMKINSRGRAMQLAFYNWLKLRYFRIKSMKRNLRSLLLSGDLDAVPVAIAGFFIIQALCAYGGIGITPDSIVYISTAQHIHDQGTINDFTNMPLMDFPAFYPIFLSGILFLTGHGVMAFGPALNGLLFALVIFLCGWMMNRFLHRSRGYTLVLLLIIAGSPCLLEVYSMIWSETLFLVLSLLFMIGCYHYFRTHAMRWLV